MIPFPQISPEIFTINLFGIELALRWYALAYLVGLLIGWRIMVMLMRRPALWGDAAPMRPEQVEELLTWVGLKEKMDANPETLSGGERQRAAIARAVVGKPEIILADEPTGNVDHEMAARLMRLFVQLNKLGSTVVIATHDLELVREIGAPVMRIENGRLTMNAGMSLAAEAE